MHVDPHHIVRQNCPEFPRYSSDVIYFKVSSRAIPKFLFVTKNNNGACSINVSLIVEYEYRICVTGSTSTDTT